MSQPHTSFSGMFFSGVNLTVLKVIIFVSNLVTHICLVRYLGVKGFGTFTTISSIYALYAGISILGFGSFLIREVAKNPKMAWKIYLNTLYAGLGVSILCTLAALVFLKVVHYPALIRLGTVILLLSLFPSFILYMLEQLYIAIEKVGLFTWISLLRTLVEMAIILSALKAGITILGLLELTVALRLLFAGGWMAYLLRLFPKVKWRVDFRFIKKIFQLSFIFAMISIAGSILFKVDVLFLTKIAGVYQTGIYSAAMKFVMMESAVINSFVFVLYPIASREYKKNDQISYARLCNRTLQYFSLAQVLAVVTTIGLSHELVGLVYGSQFTASASLLEIMAFLVIPLSNSAFLGMMLSAGKSQNWDLLSVTIATICSLGLHYFLVRAYGYYGTAWATILSFSMVVGFQAFFVHQRVFKITWGTGAVKPGLALAAAVASLYGMRAWSGWVKTPLVLLLCVSLFFLLKITTWAEVRRAFARLRPDAGPA